MSDQIKNIALISSAGAGKTHMLTQRFLFLYLHTKNYPLDSLYGITYTNEAAFEMKMRIIRYLDLFINETPSNDAETSIIAYFKEHFPNLKELALQKKRYLLNNLSELNISTFHSLFASFLSTIPFAAGILPGYEIIDEAEEELIFDNALNEFVVQAQHDEKNTGLLFDFIEHVEGYIKKNIKELYKFIIPYKNYLESLSRKEGKLKTAQRDIEIRLKKIIQKLLKFVEQYKEATYTKKGEINKNFDKKLGDLNHFLESGDLEVLDKNKFFLDLDEKKYFKDFIKKLPGKTEQQKIFELSKTMKAIYYSYLETLSNLEIVSHIKPLLIIDKIFQQEKQKKNVITFNDIENYTLRALKINPEPDYLYFKISKEIRHLMIDEFQDTSLRQLEILEPIISELISVAPVEKSFFYVGDPYQAIYRWRGGSALLFDYLINKYPGRITRERLNINYRSKKNIVDFVNKVLNRDDQVKADNDSGWVRFELLGSFQSLKEYNERSQKRTIEIIKDLHEEYGYDYSDIAVLVRKNDFGRKLTDEIAQAGIPCITESNAVLLNDCDVQFILNILKFLDKPDDDFTLSKILLMPIFDFKEKTLINLRLLGKTLFMALCRIHPDWSATKVLSSLLNKVYFCNVYELVYTIYKELKLELSYGLVALLDAALDYTRSGFNSLGAFIDWLEERGKIFPIKRTHQEGVRVLTVHKAKGLEFEVVILPDTGHELKKSENKKLIFSYRKDRPVPDKLYWRKYGQYLPGLKEAESQRQIADEMHTLYVALTRAKQGIFILGSKNWKGKIQGLWTNKIVEQLGQEEYGLGEIIKKAPRAEHEKAQKTYGRIRDQQFMIKEERSLYAPTERGVEILGAARRKGLELGSMLHFVLSEIIWLDGLVPENVIEDKLEKLKELYARSDQEKKEIEEEIRPRLIELLKDRALRFVFYKENRKIFCKNEVQIYFAEKNNDVVGKIDRLLVTEQEALIIDYKSGAEKKEYQTQMKVYKCGIKKIYPQKQIRAFLIYIDRTTGQRVVEV